MKKKIIIAVLFSGLIGPGIGQIYNRDFKKGLMLIGFTFLIIILFFNAVTKASLNMLPPGAEINLETIQEIQQKLYQKHPAPFHMFNIIMISLWVYGIADAYYVAKQRINHEHAKT